MQRVQKLLSNYGYCSRRKAEKLIEEGRVKVNNEIIKLGDKATETDIIKVDNKAVKKQQKIYLMLNKPTGCVTAVKDEFKKTLMEYVKISERVFPIGRLDYNTTGLILLTNDGDFANKVMHPRYETKKTYVAEIDRDLSNANISIFRSGVKLTDGITSPAKVKKIALKKYEIVIHEGRNRIIRRMFKKLGYVVLSLSRIKIGGLGLGNLPVGRTRILNKNDIEKILS